MDLESRGQAGVVALGLAAVVLLAGLWVGFGMSRGDAPENVGSAPTGPTGLDPRVGADALCSELEQERGRDRSFPEGAAFRRVGAAATEPPDRRTPAGVDSLDGSLAGDAIHLTWKATGEEAAAGWVVERVGDGGEVLLREELGAEARSYDDGPLPALRGSRTYRVTALSDDGAAAGAEQRVVRFLVEVRIEFRGFGDDGRAEFTVFAEGREPTVFPAAVGSEIGAPREDLDWRTGWIFAGLRGNRQTVERPVEVPRFADDGKLERSAETGEIVTETRVLPVPQLIEGAVVLPPDAPDVERWLPRSED